MAKVGIMTFLHNENCGSGLQAWALQETLRELGWEPLGLDYRPDRAEQLRNLLRSGNSPAVIREKSSRFSSTQRSRYGLFLPGSVSVPRYSRIWSAVRSQT